MKRVIITVLITACLCFLILHKPTIKQGQPYSQEFNNTSSSWGARYGSNVIWFATEKDVDVFKSFDGMRQSAIICNNNGHVVTFQKGNTNG